jgi:hypothetical protein
LPRQKNVIDIIYDAGAREREESGPQGRRIPLNSLETRKD